MRILKFDETNKESYDLLYEAFVLTDRPLRGGEVRLCSKVFDRLEAIGKLDEKRSDPNGRYYYVFEKSGSVKLEEPEYKLLLECIQSINWSTIGARRALPMIEWLESIKEE